MKFFILILFSPAVLCSQRYRKSTNPNDEPFLPIHPDYPYNPKLMKRGIEQQPAPQLQPQSSAQSLASLSPELYAPKLDSRDSYTASYAQSSPYISSSPFDPYKSAATSSALSASPYLSSAYSSYNTNPYGLLNSYGSPYAGATPGPYATAGASGPYGATVPGSYGASPYAAASGYPNYFYQPPYYYPNYYNQPPYPPPPPGYPATPYGKLKDEEDEEEDDKRRGKSKKSGKNRLSDSDRDAVDNQYVDGGNFIISSAKDLDGESSTHRTPTTYNHIESSEIHPRTVVLPKATYRLVSVSGQQSGGDYGSSPPAGYIKIQQLENLMRQALAKLLAQNAAQQANLAQIQEAAAAAVQQQQSKDAAAQQYIAVPNTIAKTGLSYVVNPTILNRVNPGQYNPSQLINTQAYSSGSSSSGGKPKSVTNVSLQQSPGIYIPPTKSEPEYADYDSSDSVTTRSQSSISNYAPTAEPTRNYSYSTYRSTQQTSLDDVNFGSKQNAKS